MCTASDVAHNGTNEGDIGQNVQIGTIVQSDPRPESTTNIYKNWYESLRNKNT